MVHVSKPDRAFLLLFVVVLGFRTALFLESQHSLSGDEATVGIMAKHILEGTDRPVFAYGADYNGGAALTAYVAAVSFTMLGVSEPALKLLPFLLSLLTLFIVYRFVRACRGPWPALAAALSYGTASALLKWNFDARGGYSECQALIPLGFWLLAARCLSARGRVRDDALLGWLSGFAVYLLQLSLVLGITAFLFLVLRSWVRRRGWGLVAFLAGAGLGAGPIALFGTPGGAVGFDPLPMIARVPSLPATLVRTLTRYLPGLLGYANFEGYPELHAAPHGIEYALLWASLLVLLARRRSALADFLRRAWHREEPGPEGAPIEAILLSYVGLYLLIFSLHPLAGESPRYLVFLEPALSILVGLGAFEALGPSSGGRLRWVAVLALALGLGNRGWQVVQLLRDDRIYGPGRTSDPRTADILIDFLHERGIPRVVTEDWDLSWRIVFKTQEGISAAHNLNNLHQAGPFAAIVDADSEEDDRVRALFVKRGLKAERYLLAGKAVYPVGPDAPAAAP